jgi:prephenate dehydrogenase
MIVDKMTVIGLGLIGGSICNAVKKYDLAGEVVGFDTDSRAREYAEKNGFVDSCLESLNQKNDSGLVVVATYVDRIAETVREIAPNLNKGCIITDVGSVKTNVVESVESFLDSGLIFIGSHPIAGSEKPGIENSDPNLFKNCNTIITPSENTDEESIDLISNFWRAIGSDVLRMDPALHDRIFAYVSHLPHVAAYTLVNTLSSSDIENIFSYSGGGLKDYTRIASSSPEMWKTIFMQNKNFLLESIREFKNNLELIESAIEEDNLNNLQAILEKAQKNKLSQE